MFVKSVLSAALLAVGVVQSQRTQSLYGQCGGREWEGPTACPTGAHCYNDGDNIWYSQCVANDPDNPPLDANVPFDGIVVTQILTTYFSVGGPEPTTVQTVITYLTPVPPPPQETWVTTITVVPDSPLKQ